MNEEQLQKWLVDRVAQLAEVDPSRIDIDEPFSVYGLNSAAAISITGDIEDQFQIKVPPTAVWDYPTISAMAKFLAAEGKSG